MQLFGWGWEAIYSGEVENTIIMLLLMMIPSERAILSDLLTYYQPTLAKSLRRWFCQYLLFLYYVDFLVIFFVPALNLYQWLKLRVVYYYTHTSFQLQVQGLELGGLKSTV